MFLRDLGTLPRHVYIKKDNYLLSLILLIICLLYRYITKVNMAARRASKALARAAAVCVLVHRLSAQAPRRALFADILPKYIYSAQAPRSRAQRTHITFPQIDSEQVHPPLTHTFSRPFF